VTLEVFCADGVGITPCITQVLFPALRTKLRPTRERATDGTLVLVTALEKLYRIFERC
jgi:DNA mismatch repair protein MLH1